MNGNVTQKYMYIHVCTKKPVKVMVPRIIASAAL